MITFANDAIIRIRPVLVEDERHNLVEGEASKLTIFGCSVQPGVSLEENSMRDSTKIAWTAYLPEGADILSTDRVCFDGVEYVIDGEPERWKSPTGALSHVRVFLVRWEG